MQSNQIGGRCWNEILLLMEAIAMKQFDHYCETLRCKMSKEACLGRQLLAFKTKNHRIDAHTVLESRGFYPECYTCVAEGVWHIPAVSISICYGGRWLI